MHELGNDVVRLEADSDDFDDVGMLKEAQPEQFVDVLGLDRPGPHDLESNGVAFIHTLKHSAIGSFPYHPLPHHFVMLDFLDPAGHPRSRFFSGQIRHGLQPCRFQQNRFRLGVPPWICQLPKGEASILLQLVCSTLLPLHGHNCIDLCVQVALVEDDDGARRHDKI
jgi:hypothetical protein